MRCGYGGHRRSGSAGCGGRRDGCAAGRGQCDGRRLRDDGRGGAAAAGALLAGHRAPPRGGARARVGGGGPVHPHRHLPAPGGQSAAVRAGRADDRADPQGGQAGRGRGPEQLQVGLPQPRRAPRRLRHRPRQGHSQGHPGQRGGGHLPGHPHEPAHPGAPGGPGRHRGADDDDQLQAAGGRGVLDRLLRGGPAGPGAQGLPDHRLRRLAEGPPDLHGRGIHRGGGPEVPGLRLGAGVGAEPAGLPGAAPARRGRRDHHRQRAGRRAGGAGSVGAAGRRAVHPRVLRCGDEQGRPGPGAPGQQGA